MADKKISQLTGATTPLAGTEVLPIVQGGSTVKVSAANITAGRTVAAKDVDLTVTASSSADQLALKVTNAGENGATFDVNNAFGPLGQLAVTKKGAGNQADEGKLVVRLATNSVLADVITVSETGNQTLNTGNLVVGTSGKGIDFSANTGNVLDQYKFADFTPTWTAVTTNPVLNNGTIVGSYVRIGKNCTFQFSVTMGSTTTFGTGEWQFTAPFTASKTGVGSAWALDSGTAYYIGAAKIEAGSNLVYIWTSGNVTAWAPAVPFTWAANDRIEIGISFTV